MQRGRAVLQCWRQRKAAAAAVATLLLLLMMLAVVKITAGSRLQLVYPRANPCSCSVVLSSRMKCCNMLVHLVLFQKREGKTIGTFGAPQYRMLDWIEAHERTERTHRSTSDSICATSRVATKVSHETRGNVYMCAQSAYRVWCVYMCDAWECMCGAWECLQPPSWSVRHRRNGGGTHGRARLLLCICVCIRVSVGPHITSLGWQTGARFSWQKRNSR